MAVLILDIESGSIGAALLRSNEFIKTWREHMPIRATRDAGYLAQEIEKIIHVLLPHISLEAVRNEKITSIAVFMAPPWGTPNLQSGRPDFVPHMQDLLTRETGAFIEAPLNFYTNAGAASQAMRVVSPYEDKYLLCIVTHEMTELVLIYNGAVAGHATIPHGMNLPLRTLKAHGGLSDAEARSALNLRHPEEPLASATEHYAQEFKSAARELMDTYAPQTVWVVSPAGEYFARALSHGSIADLFPQGGVVRALRPHHTHQHLPRSASQDLFLILEALYLRYTQL